MARLGKIIRHHPRYEVGLVKNSEGNFTTSPEESLQAIADQNFPGSIPVEPQEAREAKM